MILTNLPTPGNFATNGHRLRQEMVKAITSLELCAPTDRGQTLATFLDAARVECNKSATVQNLPAVLGTQKVVVSGAANAGIVCSGALSGTRSIVFTIVNGVITAAAIT